MSREVTGDHGAVTVHARPRAIPPALRKARAAVAQRAPPSSAPRSASDMALRAVAPPRTWPSELSRRLGRGPTSCRAASDVALRAVAPRRILRFEGPRTGLPFGAGPEFQSEQLPLGRPSQPTKRRGRVGGDGPKVRSPLPSTRRRREFSHCLGNSHRA